MKKKILIILTVFTLIFSGIVFADNNGIWNLAKDLQFGVLGSDETRYGLDSYWYTFNNPVRFLKNITSDFFVKGTIYQNNSKVATLDTSGKVPISQLPFHKGDLLSPNNRLNDVGLLDNYYFDIINLGIDKITLKSSKVAVGTTFGLNNNIAGTFTSDANAISNHILIGDTAYVNGVKIDGTLSLNSVCSSSGGTATCGATSSIQPGTFYSIIGSNSPTSTNYCSKIDVSSDGSITSTNKVTAGICKLISSCDASSQNTTDYLDGTVCGSNMECQSGSCNSIFLDCGGALYNQTSDLYFCNNNVLYGPGDNYLIDSHSMAEDWAESGVYVTFNHYKTIPAKTCSFKQTSGYVDDYGGVYIYDSLNNLLGSWTRSSWSNLPTTTFSKTLNKGTNLRIYSKYFDGNNPNKITYNIYGTICNS